MTPDRRALMTGLVASATLSGLPVKASAQTGAAASPTGADAVLDSVFAATTPPALAGAVVTRTGLDWSGVRGVRRAGSGDAATLADRWHLGSNTKAMTAALYGRLVEKGQAKWGATAAELFPDAAIDPAWAGATVENFLNHTSGLRDNAVIGMSWLMTARANPRPLPEQRVAIAAQALQQAPTGPAGQFAYSNAGYILIGAAIERIVGASWEDAMTAEVFEPLGLTSAGFGPPQGDQPWGHGAPGGVDPTNPGADNPLALGPAGTAHMSLADYAAFVRVFLTEGGGWLKPETVTHLTTPAAAGARSYALGWITLVGQAWAKGPVIAHEGSNTMWHSMVVADPAAGRGFIALANDETRGGPACQQLVRRLIQQG